MGPSLAITIYARLILTAECLDADRRAMAVLDVISLAWMGILTCVCLPKE
jgi:hypothetical protein